MRSVVGLVITIVLSLLMSGCQERAGASTSSVGDTRKNIDSVNITNHFRPSATLQEIMLAVIDPNIDPIWNSISTESSAEGVVELRPHSEEDWAILRNHAITLREAANLLVIPGRKVAHPNVSTSTHHSELEAQAIDNLIKTQWPAFVQAAHALHDAAGLAVEAIDAKDVDRLEEVGGIIEQTCESCHSQFWYPGDKVPAISQ